MAIQLGSEIKIDFLPSFYTSPNPKVNVSILPVPTIESFYIYFKSLDSYILKGVKISFKCKKL